MAWMLGLTAALALCDQAIKAAIRRVPFGGCIWRLDGLVEITHVRNTGAAFSLLSGHTALLAALSLLLMAAVFAYVQWGFQPARATRLAAAALLGGALGNLMDRLRLGGVTDYIRLLCIDFPVFNLADVLITAGVGALMLLALLGRLEDAARAEDGDGGR